MKKIIEREEIKEFLNELNLKWEILHDYLSKRFEFSNFQKAMKFANSVGELAEASNHHPKICINYDEVILETYTHEVGGITQKDLDLIEDIEKLFK